MGQPIAGFIIDEGGMSSQKLFLSQQIGHGKEQGPIGFENPMGLLSSQRFLK
jgi:hypothetical protein